ncbi:hypothetical protein MD535_23800 [Vibrio sp. ZSDZ65]|uniref:Uncharacterized protein n=1 Tax=Vibrio qingdaonensis TaxID=2829491 RepID=A0A9X3CT03_9VIBR|nr:hypothetical protein [Vibrio qingdaonensis]MCW8349019.1 hypothetical protein [Vibrio qingdaonensis]
MKIINDSNSPAQMQFNPQSDTGKKLNKDVPAGSNAVVQLDGDNDYNVTATINGNQSNVLQGISNSTPSITVTYKNGNVKVAETAGASA